MLEVVKALAGGMQGDHEHQLGYAFTNLLAKPSLHWCWRYIRLPTCDEALPGPDMCSHAALCHAVLCYAGMLSLAQPCLH